MKTFGKILKYLALTVILAVAAVFIALQLPVAQTYLTGKATELLDDMFTADIRLDGVSVKPFTTMAVKGLTIIDPEPKNEGQCDTLLHIDRLDARFSLKSLIGRGHDDVIIKKVRIDGMWINMVIEDDAIYPSNLSRLFNIRRDSERPAPLQKDVFTIQNIKAQNFRYTMQIMRGTHKYRDPGVIDWYDFDAMCSLLEAENFKMSHGKFSVEMKQFAAIEKSGFEITSAKASAVFGLGDALISGFHVEDNHGSSADFDMEMIGHTPDFSDFKHLVTLIIDLHESNLCLATLGHIIPRIPGNEDVFLEADGRVSGTIADAQIEKLNLTEKSSGMNLSLTGDMKGLPNVKETLFNMSAKVEGVKTAQLDRMLRKLAPKAGRTELKRFGAGKVFGADIRLKGTVADLDTRLSVRQGRSYGSAHANARIKNLGTDKALEMAGNIHSDGLDLGSLLGNNLLGPCTFTTDASLKLSKGDNEIALRLKKIDISELEFKEYAYHGIKGDVALTGDELTVELNSSDPDFDVDANVWTSKYEYNASLNIRNADLYALNLDSRVKSEVAANIYCHLDRDLDNLQGNASVTEIMLTNEEGTEEMGDITVTAGKNNGIYDINVSSDAVEGSFTGNTAHMDTKIDVLNTRSLLAYLLPGSYIDSGTHIEACLKEDGSLNGTVSSRRLAMKENYIKDFLCKVDGTLKKMTLTMSASEIKGPGFTLGNNTINADIENGIAHLDYKFRNDGTDNTHGELDMEAMLNSISDMELLVKPTQWFIKNQPWDISSSSASIKNGVLSVNGFCVTSGEQTIGLNGSISRTSEGEMNARIRNLDMSLFNNFITKFDLAISGKFNGDASVTSPVVGKMPNISINMHADDIKMGANDLGRFAAACDYDVNFNHFYLSANQKIAGKDVMQANAILSQNNNHLEADISADGYPIDFVQRIIPNVFTQLSGDVSGLFSINGPLKELEFSSRNARLDNGAAVVNITHVPYTAEGPLQVDNSGVHMDGVYVKDRFGQSAAGHGGFAWNRGRNIMLDVSFDANNLELVDIPENQALPLLFGHVFGTGEITFKGPFRNIVMDMNVSANENSELHLTRIKDYTASKSDLLTFVKPEEVEVDPYEELLSGMKEKKRRMSEFTMKMHALVDPKITMYLDIGFNQFAARMEGTGNGELDIFFERSTKDYDIQGDYVLNEGKVDVNVSSIVHKIFQIEDGSSLRFQGEVFDTNVDLNGSYETKASITSLIADETGYDTRRTVLCGINIKNNIKNPDIKLSINIPDLNPSIKASVESALSTDDKVQKQFLSLLLSNSFLPDEKNNIINNSSLLLSNVSEMMSNQVNNIFNKLNIPLDLGLRYQSSERGNNLFDVALSTHLFNNRVIIGGNFGNRENLTSNNGTFFGDVDVQFKVTRSGAFRVKAFSHSADKYTNFLDNSQRNGVGLTLQQEFDSFPEWINRIFSNKEKREAKEQQEAAKTKKQQTIILDE